VAHAGENPGIEVQAVTMIGEDTGRIPSDFLIRSGPDFVRNPAGPGVPIGPERAGEGIRTLDIQLGKLTLYQLSYARGRRAIVYQCASW
jgi:hypothetical protein